MTQLSQTDFLNPGLIFTLSKLTYHFSQKREHIGKINRKIQPLKTQVLITENDFT